MSDGGLPLHAYAATTTGQTSYVVTVTVTKTGENSAGKPVDESGVAAGNVSVSDPTIHAALSGFAGFVGQVYTGPVATFTDDAPDTDAGDYSATIDWGDGATTTGLVRATNQAGQSFVVYDGGTGGVLHSYAACDHGHRALRREGHDRQDNDRHSGHSNCSNPHRRWAPSRSLYRLCTLPSPHTRRSPAPATAGRSPRSPTTIRSSSSRTTPSPTRTTSIRRSSPGETGPRASGRSFSQPRPPERSYVTGTHTYMFPTTGSSPDVASVTITKNATAETSVASGDETVADSLLFPYSNQFLTVTEGSNQQIVAGLFTDADPFVTAANFNGPFVSQTVISWGDNKSTVGTIQADPKLANVFDVVGLHIYVTPTPIGQYDTISVSVTDQWGGKTTITSNMTVTPAALNFTNPFAISTDDAAPITEGKSFTSDVAIFNSNNPDATAGEYTASIDWGDGSTPLDAGTIKEDGKAGFHVSGTHTYLTTGVFNISVTILVVGSPAPVGPTLTSNATVYGAPIQYTPPSATVMTTTTGTPIPVNANFTAAVGSFTSTNPDADPNNFLANIDWGDGDSSFWRYHEPQHDPGARVHSQHDRLLGHRDAQV